LGNLVTVAVRLLILALGLLSLNGFIQAVKVVENVSIGKAAGTVLIPLILIVAAYLLVRLAPGLR
jgi:hypothetical protein